MIHCKINAFILVAIMHELSLGLMSAISLSEVEMEAPSFVLMMLLTQIKTEQDKSFENIVKNSNLNLDNIPEKLSNFINSLINFSKEYTAKPAAQVSSLYVKLYF